MTIETVAYEALNLSKQNARDIGKHEDICAERYEGIHNAIDEMKTATKDSISEIKGTLKWVGTSAFSVIMAMLGFLVVQQLNTNADIRDNSATEILRLKQQLAEVNAVRATQAPAPKESHADTSAGN